MKYIKEFLETVVKIKPLGELTTKDDELNGMSGEMVYIDGKCADIFISHADYANWLESKYEQKPVDDIEPKFKVGDWVAHNRTRTMAKVVDAKPMIVTVVNTLGDHHTISTDAIEKNYHLWSIEDAKDGDVLVHNGCVFIFMGIKDGVVKAFEENLLDGTNPVNFGESDKDKDYCPATNEQRDTLFAKMHEAGYTFDFEKKELKKIDNEEINGEDYGIDGLYHAQRILEKTLGEVDGYQSDDGILDHKAAITAVKKLYEKKPAESIKFDNEFENQVSNLLVSVLNGEHEYNEGFVKYVAQSLLGYAKNELKPTEWSHEDDVMVHDILGWLPTKTRPEYNQRRADWIKSLKNRVCPKQEWSEEDEKMFNSALWHIKNSCSNGGKNSGEFEVYNWVKSVKDRVRPQNNIVTDKELAQAKKEAYNETLDKIEYHDDWPTFDDGWSAAIWYLKKRNTMPQNQWKPSEEQITWLYRAADDASKDSRMKQILNELLSDLKKLKGE